MEKTQWNYIYRYYGRKAPAWKVAVPFLGYTEDGIHKKREFTYIENVDFNNPREIPESVMLKCIEFMDRPAHLAWIEAKNARSMLGKKQEIINIKNLKF